MVKVGSMVAILGLFVYSATFAASPEPKAAAIKAGTIFTFNTEIDFKKCERKVYKDSGFALEKGKLICRPDSVLQSIFAKSSYSSNILFKMAHVRKVAAQSQFRVVKVDTSDTDILEIILAPVQKSGGDDPKDQISLLFFPSIAETTDSDKLSLQRFRAHLGTYIRF